MSRTRVRRRRFRTALVGAGLLFVVAAPTGAVWAGPDAEPVAARRYVVEAGDTLWEIAAAQARGADPRPIVDAIAEANDLGPQLRPGQRLVIPAAG